MWGGGGVRIEVQLPLLNNGASGNRDALEAMRLLGGPT